MARDIKFRGKRVDNGEWIEGWYYQNHYDDSLEEQDVEHIIIGIPNNQDYVVIPESVGQYTGKKDHHGTEICQGDICKNGDWEPDANAYNYRIEEVVWDDGNAMWLGWNSNDNGMCCEIIGNVHEHPERLEGKT